MERMSVIDESSLVGNEKSEPIFNDRVTRKGKRSVLFLPLLVIHQFQFFLNP